MIIIGGTPDDWGFIPTFLDEDDPRRAKEQFAAKYVGGWNKFDGFTFDDKRLTLKYPGDPIMHAMGAMPFRHELVLLFPSAWVLILQTDGDWEVARMD